MYAELRRVGDRRCRSRLPRDCLQHDRAIGWPLNQYRGICDRRPNASFFCPCRTILLLALLTRLPAPWTPASLGRALSATNLWPGRGTDDDLVEDGRLEYGDRTQVDPCYRAERNPGTGRWLVRIYERGGLRATQHMDDDQQLCEFLIEQTLRLAYPYGWKTDATWSAQLDAGAARALRWWSVRCTLPYLESHRSDGVGTSTVAGIPNSGGNS